jgi:hypothetical protein
MAIFQIQSKDSVYRINDTDAISCIQNFNWDAQMSAEQLAQIGSANYDAQIITPEVSAQFEFRSTGATAGLLSRMIYDINGVSREYIPPASTGATLNNDLITEVDLERAVCDIIEAKRADTVFDRSLLIPRAHLRSISLSARVDGTASESYSFDADDLEIYRKPYHDIRSVPFTRDATNKETVVVPPAGFKVEAGSTLADATHKIIYISVDGDKFMPADVTVDDAEHKITLTAGAIAAGKSFPVGSRVHVICHAKAPGAMPQIVVPAVAAVNNNYGTSARFVKADKIDIWLVHPDTTFTVGSFTNKKLVEGDNTGILDHATPGDLNAVAFASSDLFLKVQSCDISLDLQREALREIRKNSRGNPVFYRAAQFPMDVNVSISALESDLNDWAKLGSTAPTGAGRKTKTESMPASPTTITSQDVLDLASFESPQWMVVMRYYKGDTVLQTIVVQDARTSGIGQRMQVRGRSEVSYTLTGSRLFIKGSAV